jgi:protein gp37
MSIMAMRGNALSVDMVSGEKRRSGGKAPYLPRVFNVAGALRNIPKRK